MGVTNRVGRKPKINRDNKPLLNALLNTGYTIDNICNELKLSKTTYLVYFGNCEEFKIKHIQKIAYLLNKPLHEVLNIALSYKSNAPQWLSPIFDKDIIKNESK